jgi:bla regulator protein BlaR1
MSVTFLMSALGWTLLHFVWQGAAIGVLSAAGLWLLRHASPRARYTLACGALLACLAWPAAHLWQLLAEAGSGAAPATALASMMRTVPAVATAPLAWMQAHLGMLVLAWLAGCCALSLRLLLGLLWIRRAARSPKIDGAWQARVSHMAQRGGIRRPIALRVVDELKSPLTAGWWHPVILMPAALLAGMPPDLLEALIAHELGHVKRCDYLVNLLQNVIETLLFYHPAVWWISSRIRAEREHIADDFAARQLGDARRLALALSELEKRQFSQHHLALAANQGELMSRIKRLLRPARPPCPSSAWRQPCWPAARKCHRPRRLLPTNQCAPGRSPISGPAPSPSGRSSLCAMKTPAPSPSAF